MLSKDLTFSYPDCLRIDIPEPVPPTLTDTDMQSFSFSGRFQYHTQTAVSDLTSCKDPGNDFLYKPSMLLVFDIGWYKE